MFPGQRRRLEEQLHQVALILACTQAFFVGRVWWCRSSTDSERHGAAPRGSRLTTTDDSEETLFSTQREEANADDALSLLGLDHPNVDRLLGKYRTLEPEEIGVSIGARDGRTGALGFWAVAWVGEKGQTRRVLLRLAVDTTHQRIPAWERQPEDLLFAERQILPRDAQSASGSRQHDPAARRRGAGDRFGSASTHSSLMSRCSQRVDGRRSTSQMAAGITCVESTLAGKPDSSRLHGADAAGLGARQLVRPVRE